MSRLPFDPDRARGSKHASRGDDRDQPLTITQLAKLIKDVVGQHAPAKLRVIGEVSNFNNRNHWFFSLKDAGATIRCVCFASAARKVRFPVRDGMEVVATGRLDFFDAQGSLQLYVDKIEAVGEGTLEMQFRALCEELREAGYFDADHKQPLPYMATRVAVITSRTSAALQDVINTASRRWAGCELLLYDARMQGEGAAPQIARAIRLLSQRGGDMGIDAIIVTRGGGSMEDLWAFNERIVADAIYDCTIPIVAAIGHETDTTIAELVADERRSTPTQAAMAVVPDAAALAQQVEQLGRRLTLLVERHLRHERQRVDAIARLPWFARPERMLEPIARRLDELQGRATFAVKRRAEREAMRVDAIARHPFFTRPDRILAPKVAQLDTIEQRLHAAVQRTHVAASDQLDALARELHAVGPMNVLQRGYTYTLGPRGELLRTHDAAKPGSRVTTVFADGRMNSTVDGEGESAPAPPRTPPPPRRRRKRKGDDDASQMNLFG